jgi:2-dehydropantoate 2-reductase
MRILVYGAGPLGSLFAAKLKQGGHEVALLARGQRLKDLRKYGVVLENWRTKEQTTTRVEIVDTLAPEDTYELVFVLMRKKFALDILPILASNCYTPNVLFLMNNFTGPQKFIDALGKERVLIGFPGAAGYREGHIVHCLAGDEKNPTHVYIGEVDGRITERLNVIAEAIEKAPHFEARIRTDMDAWLRTHIAFLILSMAPALYMCGTDNYRMSRTRDALVLTIRAIRESFQVLRALHIPITPLSLKIMTMLPEPFLVYYLGRMMSNPLMEVAMVKHAESVRDDIKVPANEFLKAARKTKVPIPAIETLFPHLDTNTPLMPAGSREIRLDWSGVLMPLVLIAAIIILLVFMF